MAVKPHSSNGVVRAYTLNHSKEEIPASLAINYEDETRGTGKLTLADGSKKIIKWDEITFMRDLVPGEVL